MLGRRGACWEKTLWGGGNDRRAGGSNEGKGIADVADSSFFCSSFPFDVRGSSLGSSAGVLGREELTVDVEDIDSCALCIAGAFVGEG